LIVFGYSFLCIFLFMMIYWWVIQTRRGHYEHATDHWYALARSASRDTI
jgi:hypothetical protein